MFEHRHPDNSVKSQGKLSLCFPLPWEFQPLKPLSLFLNKFLYIPLMFSNWLSKILSEWWTTSALSCMKDKQLLGSRRGCYNSSCHGRHTKLQDLFLSLRSLWSWDQPMIACGPDLACHLFLCGLQGRMVFIFSRGRKKIQNKETFPARILEWVCHFLLQGIFHTQGSNMRLLHLLDWQVGSVPSSPPGKTRSK